MSYIEPPRSADLDWSKPGEFPTKSGWYPASDDMPPYPATLRWFDADKKTWSVPAWPEFTAEEAAERALCEATFPGLIRWAKPWWEKKQ